MLQHLALDPKLGLTPAEMAAAWNDNATLRARAEAKVGQAPPGTFIDPLLAGALVSFVVLVAGELTKELLLDLIRGKRARKGEKALVVEIVEKELPSGERLMITRVTKG